jgi:hypothetical protein
MKIVEDMSMALIIRARKRTCSVVVVVRLVVIVAAVAVATAVLQVVRRWGILLVVATGSVRN